MVSTFPITAYCRNCTRSRSNHSAPAASGTELQVASIESAVAGGRPFSYQLSLARPLYDIATLHDATQAVSLSEGLVVMDSWPESFEIRSSPRRRARQPRVFAAISACMSSVPSHPMQYIILLCKFRSGSVVSFRVAS